MTLRSLVCHSVLTIATQDLSTTAQDDSRENHNHAYMKLLAELTNETFGLEGGIRKEPYKVRRAARAVLFNEKGEIAFQKVERDGFYKLPGGGVDAGETVEEGLRREIREEVGCEITIGEEVGMVIEFRNEFGVLQFSYVWLAKIDGELGEPALEQEEIEEGMVPMWMTL